MRRSNLRQLIFGEIKFARKQAYRDRTTRFGLARGTRHVVDEFPDVAAAQDDDADLAYQREVAWMFIREYARREVCVELIERSLLLGGTVSAVAIELRINCGSARSEVSRFRKYLNLPMKRQHRKPV